MICLSTTHGTIDRALDAVRRNGDWIDLVELRVDFLEAGEQSNAYHFPRLAAETLGRPLPVICTLRRQRDGGRFSGPETDRFSLLETVLSGSGFAFLDLEEDLLETPGARKIEAAFPGRIIRSFHDIQGTPEDLDGLYRRLAGREEEIPKLAVQTGSSQDAQRVLKLLVSTQGRERIIIGMGEFGFPTRIVGRRFGCFLTYASDLDRPGTAHAAPGHLSPRLLQESYHYREITDKTTLFGIIGNPVLHSRSPAYHTAAFRSGGFDGLYVPFPVDDLDAFFAAAEQLEIQGLSVTIPHKQNVRRYLVSEAPAVEGAGACNTLIRSDRGWQGTNTDVPGFLEPLLSLLGTSASSEGALRGLRATVIGAGGAARGAVYALVTAEAEVLILNRSPYRAEGLAESISGPIAVGGLDDDGIAQAGSYRDIVVQTSSVGMAPQEGQDPLPGLAFGGDEIVYDMIYVPEETRFLRRAREAGCRTIGGMAMFRRQAELQQELFRTRL